MIIGSSACILWQKVIYTSADIIITIIVFTRKQLTYGELEERGITFAKIDVDVPAWPWKIAFLYTFLTHLSNHQYTIFDRKVTNFAKIGCLLK